MSRRLEEATTEALLTGGRAGRQAVEDAGFSEELKERLLSRVQDASFKSRYASALASAEAETRGVGVTAAAAAAATHHQAWTGEERTEDAVLRMLDDAKKPLGPGLRSSFQAPPVDMRIKRDPVRSPGQRVSRARDMASTYSEIGVKVQPSSKGATGSVGKDDNGDGVDVEREERRRVFRERFEPGARSMPNTISGLAALANERIEDAIARGQFKNIPRGKGVERDARADNPFIDTTEYIMNKMIRRQDIVPPWIEKQQDLSKAAHSFRTRLRNDWKRHAARSIAARGGSLVEQMARAEAFAESERLHNPRMRKTEEASPDPIKVEMQHGAAAANVNDITTGADVSAGEAAEAAAAPAAAPEHEKAPLPPPFRDPTWEAAERSYMQLSINNLNTITRAYNLMAPDLAKKPYFSLERELLNAYAEVAPQLAGEIRQRATRAVNPGLGTGGTTRGPTDGLLEYLGGGPSPRIHVEAEEKAYGIKDWWRDFWAKKG